MRIHREIFNEAVEFISLQFVDIVIVYVRLFGGHCVRQTFGGTSLVRRVVRRAKFDLTMTAPLGVKLGPKLAFRAKV